LRRIAMVALALLVAVPGSAAAAVEPYGANDAGGFRNLLPPGEDGLVNFQRGLEFRGKGTVPPHFADQQPLYEGLLYASPTLTDAQVASYFKDATFGVPPEEVESMTTPRPGVTIVRDSAYGIPHIYGDTRADVMFGAGYAAANDRLFLMDILRHTGRAELSSFLGGGNAATDAATWGFAPYTEADLERQLQQDPQLYGQSGRQAVEDVQSYIEGINRYVDDANADPALKPAEYTLLGRPMEPWKPTDVIAIASLIGAQFGQGGGAELLSAETLQAFERRFGRKLGRKAWLRFRSKNDPATPTTISQRFPYETESPFAKRGLAIPDPGSARMTPPTGSSARASSAHGRGSFGLGAMLLRALHEAPHASNWELVPAKNSRSGHPLAVMGPQVGYVLPEIMMEEDLHGPELDARGVAFPGVNLFVQIGHGRDYAWSATSAGSDNIDTFAEVLCKDRVHYLYRGRCRPMEKLVRVDSWTPNAIDSTPAGSQTLVAYRTVHGIVYARGRVHGRKVAFVRERSTYFHEADSVIGFSRLNEPGFLTGPSAFKRAVSHINFTFNWSYVDSKHIAYAVSGAYPRRARGTSPDFPVLGTGKFDWRGFKPATQTADYLPFSKHPQAVDPPYLVSWNNKQAPGWAAADSNYSFGPVFRSQMISDRVRRDIRGKRRMTIAELVQAMEEPASQDLRGYRLLPILLKAVGKPKQGSLRRAVAELRSWHKAGSHRRDLNRDGVDEHNAAVELMDAWWPKLVTAEFRPVLGSRAFEQLQEMIGIGDHTGGSPEAPGFQSGWWGYVARDLHRVFGSKRQRGQGPLYCGRGLPARCRRALQRSLRAALRVSPKSLYGGGDGACASNPQPSCFDQNRFTVTSTVELPPFPFQNRPTYQQVVTVERRLPR
jgi:acyl-homoserine lactone acylase PvdQ